MKPNETPEKIYITPNFQRRWFTKEIDDTSVEYIRTNDFIKKACFWLELNLSDRPKEDIKFWLEDFINYIKGE